MPTETVETVLARLKDQADQGKIEFILCVDVQRDERGNPQTTVTVASKSDIEIKPEQTDRIVEDLRAIAAVLSEVYAEKNNASDSAS